MLTVVPTPIGNLGDFTPRAKEAIEEADFVLAEDTRTTGSLLRLNGLEARLRAFHAHNEHKVVDVVVANKCYSYINEDGTHISICDCKYGGIGETDCS